MDREKVAVIAPGALAASSGKHRPAEKMLERMIPYAAEQLHIRIFGIAEGPLPSQGWIGSVPFYRLPAGRLYLESLLRHLRKWRPDTVDVHGRPLLACQLKGRLPLSRVLLTLPSAPVFSPTCHPKACTPHILESVDGLIVGSERAKAELQDHFPSLLTPVWVNLPGASLEDHVPRWTPDGELLRRRRLAELGWTDRKSFCCPADYRRLARRAESSRRSPTFWAASRRPCWCTLLPTSPVRCGSRLSIGRIKRWPLWIQNGSPAFRLPRTPPVRTGIPWRIV
ncbi:hypothetical protein HMSSN139_63470 [Paenibacillus sp. HMSSN-139]|nr:hypothetical protein HMSSN139_63470 [Paenibacillus sp. HMSSN-139]